MTDLAQSRQGAKESMPISQLTHHPEARYPELSVLFKYRADSGLQDGYGRDLLPEVFAPALAREAFITDITLGGEHQETTFQEPSGCRQAVP